VKPILDKVMVFDVGGTKTTYGVVENDVISHFDKIDSNVINEKGIDFFIETIDKIYDEKISGIIIGVPAVVDNNGNILSAPNLKSIESSTLKLDLQKKYSVPVHITRDVNLQLLGEYATFYKDDFKNALGIFIGTGLGASVIIDKKIYTGFNGAAVEIGHVHYPLNYNIQCNCGKKDCMELFSSGMAIEKYVEKYNLEFDKELSKNDFFICQDEKIIKYKELFFNSLSFAISTLINLFDPGLVVIGGGVINANEFPYDHLIEKIKSDLRAPLPKGNTIFKISKLNYKSNILGGSYYFKDLK
jgi:predicted NBD/HSP70 family sugar kinase